MKLQKKRQAARPGIACTGSGRLALSATTARESRILDPENPRPSERRGYFPFVARSISATILSTAEQAEQPPLAESQLHPSHGPPESHNPRRTILRTARNAKTAINSSTIADEMFISKDAIESPSVNPGRYYHRDASPTTASRRLGGRSRPIRRSIPQPHHARPQLTQRWSRSIASPPSPCHRM